MKKIVLILCLVLLLLGWMNPGHPKAAKSINEEIIYDIMVDRFNNGDTTLNEQVDVKDPYAYHGGDLQGIIKRLDYIKELGFTAISLSPIMENAPNGYHGYWVEDFFKVEKQFGTMDDLKTLVKEAHKRDMKVILEFVVNYVAKNHPFVLDPEKVKPTKLADPLWLDETVTLNVENQEVRNMLFDAADYWLTEANVDGYKLHAIDQTPTAFLKAFVNHVKQTDPDAYLIGSVLKNEDLTKDKLDAGIPLVEQAGMQGAMVNVFTNIGTPVEEIYQSWKASGERTGILSVDNKFTERFTRKIVEAGQNPQTTWKLALTYMYTSPGVPLIFQGSAIPMDGDTPEKVQQLVQFNQSDQDLQDFFNKIAALRQQFPVLAHGDMELAGTNGGMSVFKRTDGDTTIFIAINNDDETKSVSVTDVPEGMQLTGVLGDNIVRENENGKYKIGLERELSEIYIVEEDTGFNWLFIGLIVGIFVTFVVAVVLLSRKQKKRSVQTP